MKPLKVAIVSNGERMTDATLWHNGSHPITPKLIVESLSDAKAEIDYSNYDCNNLNRLREILYRYVTSHNIPPDGFTLTPEQRESDADLWHNGFHPITPEHMIDSLASAKDALSSSNYDMENLDRVKEILLRYCEENNIPRGNAIQPVH